MVQISLFSLLNQSFYFAAFHLLISSEKYRISTEQVTFSFMDFAVALQTRGCEFSFSLVDTHILTDLDLSLPRVLLPLESLLGTSSSLSSPFMHMLLVGLVVLTSPIMLF